MGRERGRRGPGGGRRRRQPGAPARRGAGVGQLGAAADVQRQLGAAARRRRRRRRRGQAGRQLGAEAGGRRRQLGAAPPGPQPTRPAGPQPRRLLQPGHPGCGQQGEPEGIPRPCALPPRRVFTAPPPRFLESTPAPFLFPPLALLPRTSDNTCVPMTPKGFYSSPRTPPPCCPNGVKAQNGPNRLDLTPHPALLLLQSHQCPHYHSNNHEGSNHQHEFSADLCQTGNQH